MKARSKIKQKQIEFKLNQVKSNQNLSKWDSEAKSNKIQLKSSQIQPNQIKILVNKNQKPNQTKSNRNQAKSSQIQSKSNQNQAKSKSKSKSNQKPHRNPNGILRNPKEILIKHVGDPRKSYNNDREILGKS